MIYNLWFDSYDVVSYIIWQGILISHIDLRYDAIAAIWVLDGISSKHQSYLCACERKYYMLECDIRMADIAP